MNPILSLFHDMLDDFAKPKPLTEADLTYAATARCPCGAGLAYKHRTAEPYSPDGYWDCSDILLGRAIPSGQEGAKTHTGKLPFVFYEITSENQPSAEGQTTRPEREHK